MKMLRLAVVHTFALAMLSGVSLAQTNSSSAAASPARANSAIVPVERPEPRARQRNDVVLKRAKDNPGECDIVFIGDSITQGWEAAGITNVWNKYYGRRKALNFGAGGDRTQHVLWRFEHGQLDGLKPKVAVVMIGTNNSSRDDNTEGEILAGVKAIVQQIRERLPNTKILVLGIFPRGESFSVQRGKILQVNQALAKLDDGNTIRYFDFGSKLIEPDGTISRDVMRDHLHLTERGYEIWGSAMEPLLAEMLR
jgi:lysophospholipase L1-like esterase